MVKNTLAYQIIFYADDKWTFKRAFESGEHNNYKSASEYRVLGGIAAVGSDLEVRTSAPS